MFSPSTLCHGGTTLGDQQVDVYHPTQLRGVLSSILDVHIHLVTICRLLLGLITLSPPNTHREEAL